MMIKRNINNLSLSCSNDVFLGPLHISKKCVFFKLFWYSNNAVSAGKIIVQYLDKS